MDKNYVERLQKLLDHLHDSADRLMTEMDETHKYDNKYDIKIEINGVSAIIELHADAYENMAAMLQLEVNEFYRMKLAHEGTE